METVRVPMEQLVDILRLQLDTVGRAELGVTGSSMHPMLRNRRDRVVLVYGTPKNKDVILYRRDSGAYILHRIVRVRDGLLICSGDNQWQTEQVRPNQVLAVVDSWYHKGRLKTGKSPGYRFYVWLWTGLLPVRRPILAVRRLCGRLLRKLKKKKT